MTTQIQVLDYMTTVLKDLNVPPTAFDNNTDVLLDLDLDITRIDFLFASLEYRYSVPPIMFTPSVSTLHGLADYVVFHQS